MTDTKLNWGKLVVEGKVRAQGKFWTPEESTEILVEKTATADEVRARYPEGGGKPKTEKGADVGKETADLTPFEALMAKTGKDLEKLAKEAELDISDCKNKTDLSNLILSKTEEVADGGGAGQDETTKQ